MKISGIYKIINKINGKYYVGSSSNITRARWYIHKSQLKHNKHINKHLQYAWNKYGSENFIFEIIELIDSERLYEIEQKYLNIAENEKNNCYNISFNALGSGRGNKHFMFGKHHSDETKKLIAERSKKWGKENGMFGVRKFGKNNPNFGNHKLRGSNNPAFDPTNYHFFNKNTNEEFIGCKYDFYTKYNLRQSNVCWLVKGKHQSVKGWMIKK